MKRIFLLPAIAAIAIGGLAGCAGMMRTGEGIIRAMTPSDAGILTTAGNVAADTHKKVRNEVLGDPTILASDPASRNGELKKE